MNEMHEKKNVEKFLNKTFCPKSRDEVQRPCQISSFMISLLHPDLLRCRNGDGVH